MANVVELENFDTERFIEEIKNRPALWDINSDDYSNRETKKLAWDQVIQIFGGKELTPISWRFMQITLQRKWKALRGSYTRELKRQEKLKAGIDPGMRKSQYLYFDRMSFLRNIVTSRSVATGNIEYVYYEEPSNEEEIVIKEENSSSDKFEEDDSNDDFSKPSELKVVVNSDVKDPKDPLGSVKRQNVKRTRYDTNTDDDDFLFLLSMLKTLQRVPRKKKMATRMKLMAVLDEVTRDLED